MVCRGLRAVALKTLRTVSKVNPVVARVSYRNVGKCSSLTAEERIKVRTFAPKTPFASQRHGFNLVQPADSCGG
jgi:hypothetical protein